MDPSNSMLPHSDPQVSHSLSFPHRSISLDKNSGGAKSLEQEERYFQKWEKGVVQSNSAWE
jgi:hypothetical protein